MTEFLPLCDVLFNVISLAGYFCNVVFDIILGYALLERGLFGYFTTVMCLVVFSLIISQIISFRWYWNSIKRKRTTSSTAIDLSSNKDCTTKERNSFNYKDLKDMQLKTCAIVAVHIVQCGVLWRYAKLFVPVNLRRVKHEVRDLCMLRLVHGFCEAAPMLLLQLYLLINSQSDSKFVLNGSEIKLKTLNGKTISPVLVTAQQQHLLQQQVGKTFKDLNIVSASLSLFSICWALASFSKNVRLQKVHRLVLTWLGVIFQFTWRLGTVTSRIVSLTLYASVYKYWVFLVIVLHWFSMLLWLISPKNVFHGERISKVRKTLLSAMIAFVYIFAYINLQEVKHRQKMFTFYTVMFLENVLLVCLWLAGIWERRPEQWHLAPLFIVGTFLIGIFFMLIYYRFFHVRRLNWESGGQYSCNDNDVKPNRRRVDVFKVDISNEQPAIAGIFSCRFTNPVGHAATKRKKKKPTTFIPPPNLRYSSQLSSVNSMINNSGQIGIPFWRRPLSRSQAGSSENEGSSAGSRVNIHQKLQEKKQKQLAELKIIEEEIKQGKLGGPITNTTSSGDDGRTSLPRQPIPRTKKHSNLLDSFEWCTLNAGAGQKNFSDIDELNNLNKYCADELYSSFGLNGINIPALEQSSLNKPIASSIPSSSQLSATESNSLTRHVVHTRTKIPHNIHLNPLLFENYCSNNLRHGSTGDNFDHLTRQNIFLDLNHPRQISGTYSSSNRENPKGVIENGQPFPYNVLPPPKSKLDSGSTPPTPSITITQQHTSQKIVSSEFLSKFPLHQYQRAKTPEVLLAPHYLDNSRVYCDWVGKDHSYRSYHNVDHVSSGDDNLDVSAADDSVLGLNEPVGHRIPSDIDSQVSLPRSYTLPREFKYYRRNKAKKIIKSDNFITSTNSSDGDVDSGDENESERNSYSDDSQCKAVQNSRTVKNNFHNHKNHHNRNKTKIIRNSAIPMQQKLAQQPVNALLMENENSSNTVSPLKDVNSITVNNLDLISSVTEGGQFTQFPNRPRNRNYVLSKGMVNHHMPYCRHETKL